VKQVMSLTQLKVHNPEAVRSVLEDELRHNQNSVNWVLFGYKDRDTLELLNKGTGGLDELKQQFGPNDIRFAVLECLVTDDDYNAVKYLLITWIGENVPAGVTKAKAAGHRKELISFLTSSVAIAAEFQTVSLAELNHKDISSSLTMRRATYQDSQSVGQQKDQRHGMSRSHANAGDRKKSQLDIVDEDAIRQALLDVHAGKHDWAHITYVEGKKDQVYLKSVGSGGLEGLRPELPNNNISFVLATFQVVETSNTCTKYVMITWVGENTPPLQKARSGAHRSELADWIITIVPFHSHYQANTPDDLSLEGVLFKLRS